MEQVRREAGRIDVLVHAAGLLVDRTLPNKEPAQFDLVFDVKVDGFFNLLRAAAGCPSARRSPSARWPAASAMTARATTALPTICSAS